MATWMVILQSRDMETGERHREVFEVTPPPEPGSERTVLGQLVRGIHAGALERSYDGAVAVFDEGPREITASFSVERRAHRTRTAPARSAGLAVRRLTVDRRAGDAIGRRSCVNALGALLRGPQGGKIALGRAILHLTAPPSAGTAVETPRRFARVGRPRGTAPAVANNRERTATRRDDHPQRWWVLDRRPFPAQAGAVRCKSARLRADLPP